MRLLIVGFLTFWILVIYTADNAPAPDAIPFFAALHIALCVTLGSFVLSTYRSSVLLLLSSMLLVVTGTYSAITVINQHSQSVFILIVPLLFALPLAMVGLLLLIQHTKHSPRLYS